MANETYFPIAKQILKATYPTGHVGLHSDDIMVPTSDAQLQHPTVIYDRLYK